MNFVLYIDEKVVMVRGGNWYNDRLVTVRSSSYSFLINKVINTIGAQNIVYISQIFLQSLQNWKTLSKQRLY